MISIVLYKNLKKVFLEDFRSDGAVKITPLKNFRDIEDPNRKDDLEGLSGLRYRPKETITGYADEFPSPEGIVIRGTNPNARPYICLDPGSVADFHTHLPDVYTFCVSEKQLNDWGEASYKIKDPVGFGYALTRALGKEGKVVAKWRLAKVQYGSYKDNVTSMEEFALAKNGLTKEFDDAAYFLKPSLYKPDREWRYVFVLVDDSKVDGSIIIKDKVLLEFCELPFR